MWYVIQVPTGQEQRILAEARSYHILEYCDDLFVPQAERRKKYGGTWHTERQILFPGYLFVISSSPEELYQSLKRIPRLTRLLGVGERWTPLAPEDVEIVERLTGRAAETNRQRPGQNKSGSGKPAPGAEPSASGADPSASDAWLMKFSEGIIEGDRVIITAGPLKGLEKQITRIDRHKRVAWIAVELLGETREMQVGLEILRKEGFEKI